MKSLMLSFAVIFALILPQAALANFGAIAYNSYNGRSSQSHGYAFYQDAINTALYACGPGCTIVNWEQNSCIALAAGYGRLGEAHGFYDANQAANAALYQCGPGCGVVEWACN